MASSQWTRSPRPVPILHRERGAKSQSAMVGIFLYHQVYGREAQGLSRSCIGKEEQNKPFSNERLFLWHKVYGRKAQCLSRIHFGKEEQNPNQQWLGFFIPSSLWVRSPRPVPILHRERGAKSQSAMVGIFYTIKSMDEKPNACPAFTSGKRSNIPISNGWDFFIPSSLWTRSVSKLHLTDCS